MHCNRVALVCKLPSTLLRTSCGVVELDLRIIELESGRVYNYGGRLHWKYVESASLATKGRHSRLAHQRDENESCLVHIKISNACPWSHHSDQVAFSCH